MRQSHSVLLSLHFLEIFCTCFSTFFLTDFSSFKGHHHIQRSWTNGTKNVTCYKISYIQSDGKKRQKVQEETGGTAPVLSVPAQLSPTQFHCILVFFIQLNTLNLQRRSSLKTEDGKEKEQNLNISSSIGKKSFTCTRQQE